MGAGGRALVPTYYSVAFNYYYHEQSSLARACRIIAPFTDYGSSLGWMERGSDISERTMMQLDGCFHLCQNPSMFHAIEMGR